MNRAMDLLDVLALTHAILLEGWTRCAMAKNAAGQSVTVDHPSARRWCLIGAYDLAFQTLFPRDLLREPQKGLWGKGAELLDRSCRGGQAILSNDGAWDRRTALGIVERAAATLGKR